MARTGSARRCAIVVAAAVAVGTVPAPAGATIAAGMTGRRVVVAHNDGTGRHLVGHGDAAVISPNGRRVAISTFGQGNFHVTKRVVIVPRTGGAGRTMSKPCDGITWSPDSRHFACANAVGGQILEGDAVTGAVRLLTRARVLTTHVQLLAFSFSPDAKQLAYIDVAPAADGLNGGALKVITIATGVVRTLRAADAETPVWGPRRIAFTVLRHRPPSNGIPMFGFANIAVIRPNGTGFRQVTHRNGAESVFGYHPVDWSANGSRLLLGFSAEDTNDSWALLPATGRLRFINGFRAVALNAAGTVVYGDRGIAAEGNPRVEKVVRFRWSGGAARTLIAHARNATASR